MNTIITRRAALALAVSLALAACGGEDPPLVASSTQQQVALASSLTIAAGEGAATKSIVSVAGRAGPLLSRVSISASASNVRAVGVAVTGGLRWIIKADGAVVAQGTLAVASVGGGVPGSTTHEIDLAGGALIETEIVAFVSSPNAAAVAWDAASVSLSIALK